MHTAILLVYRLSGSFESNGVWLGSLLSFIYYFCPPSFSASCTFTCRSSIIFFKIRWKSHNFVKATWLSSFFLEAAVQFRTWDLEVVVCWYRV